MKLFKIFGIVAIGQVLLIFIYETLLLIYVKYFGEVNSVSWGISYRIVLITYFCLTMVVMILYVNIRKHSQFLFGAGFLIYLISFFSSRIEGTPYLILLSSCFLSYLITGITVVYFEKKKFIWQLQGIF